MTSHHCTCARAFQAIHALYRAELSKKYVFASSIGGISLRSNSCPLRTKLLVSQCSRSSVGLRIKVTCHQVAALRDRTFDEPVGLINAGKASSAIATLIRDTFETDEEVPIFSSTRSRHSKFGVTSVGDVVAYRDADGLQMGRVWAHANFLETNLTVVQRFDFIRDDPRTSTALWLLTDSYLIVPTIDIVDAVIWNEFQESTIRTVRPLCA